MNLVQRSLFNKLVDLLPVTAVAGVGWQTLTEPAQIGPRVGSLELSLRPVWHFGQRLPGTILIGVQVEFVGNLPHENVSVLSGSIRK